jgi:hypothetical protein
MVEAVTREEAARHAEAISEAVRKTLGTAEPGHS